MLYSSFGTYWDVVIKQLCLSGACKHNFVNMVSILGSGDLYLRFETC